MPRITIFPQSCKGIEDCGICIFVCPKGVFVESKQMNEAGYLLPRAEDQTECTVCQLCMMSCPDFAIVVEENADNATRKPETGNES